MQKAMLTVLSAVLFLLEGAAAHGSHSHSHAHSHGPADDVHAHAHGHGHGGTGEDEAGLMQSKIGLIVALLAVCCGSWVPALNSGSLHDNLGLRAVASALSGGVFLFLGLCDMLPVAAEILAHEQSMPTDSAYMLALAGFTLMLLMGGCGGHHHHPVAGGAVANGGAAPGDADDEDECCSICSAEEVGVQASGKSPLVLLSALSLHAGLETMAIGMARNRADAVAITVSIAMHLPAEVITLLINMLRTGASKARVRGLMTVFTSVNAAGFLAGLFIQKQLNTPAVEGMVLSATAGTFLFAGVEAALEHGSTLGHRQHAAAVCAGMVLSWGLTKTIAAAEHAML